MDCLTKSSPFDFVTGVPVSKSNVNSLATRPPYKQVICKLNSLYFISCSQTSLLECHCQIRASYSTLQCLDELPDRPFQVALGYAKGKGPTMSTGSTPNLGSFLAFSIFSAFFFVVVCGCHVCFCLACLSVNTSRIVSHVRKRAHIILFCLCQIPYDS